MASDSVRRENIRIDIRDLVDACRALGEVRVVAAGCMYATLETDEAMRALLTRSLISWQID
jgi:hypothetical protein